MAEHRPFHCGSQAGDREASNCDRCTKGATADETYDTMTCPIQKALGEAFWNGGTVSEEIAERMGYLDNCPPRQDGFSYVWRCNEFVAILAAETEAR